MTKSEQSQTPRTDAIKAELRRKHPDPLEGAQKLLYYMEAAETFGQHASAMEAAEREARAHTHNALVGVIKRDRAIKALERDNAELIELLREAYDKIVAYRDHTKSEYPGGPLLQVLMPKLRRALSHPDTKDERNG